MGKLFTKGDYKRSKREGKRTSQKIDRPKGKRRKFKVGDIVKLKGGEDMGYVEFYRYDKVYVKWDSFVDYHLEDELVKVA